VSSSVGLLISPLRKQINDKKNLQDNCFIEFYGLIDIGGHWAESWIEELFDSGMTGGYPDGTYRPLNQVTRAEMAIFLLKARHGNTYTPPEASGGAFSDVAGHWAEAWIDQLAAEGITSGYPDGTFKPDRTVTRAEMAVFLVNAFGLPIL